jgi:methionyl-tRNA formyltransferase
VSLRVIFMGTPQLACPSLLALLDRPDIEVVGVVTQPDRPKGRDLRVSASPVKELALGHGRTMWQPVKARDEQFVATIRDAHPDLVVVTAFGQILPQSLLDIPRLGCLNVHTSLLPRYRGAAPIQWAILNGESETGITIMQMEAGLDTGPILSQQRTAILDTDDAQTLHDRLAQAGAKLLIQTLPGYITGEIKPLPQAEAEVSYARKITKSDGQLDWTRPARDLWNQVRGLVPWPGCFTFSQEPNHSLLKIWSAEVAAASGAPGEVIAADKHGIVVGCGGEALNILMLQREGARRLTPQQFLAGTVLRAGQRFGS